MVQFIDNGWMSLVINLIRGASTIYWKGKEWEVVDADIYDEMLIIDAAEDERFYQFLIGVEDVEKVGVEETGSLDRITVSAYDKGDDKLFEIFLTLRVDII